MKKLYTILTLSLSLYAQTLQETIDYSLQNSYQLEILNEESEILAQQANIVSTLKDPILKMGINDVQAVRPFSRNEEAMQNQFVAISQTLPTSNRLTISAEIERTKQRVTEEKKEIVQVNIAFAVRKAFIEAKSAKDNLQLLDAYIEFLKRPLGLIVNLSSVEKNSVEKYIKTELLQQSYRLQRERWLEDIEVAKERIELVGNMKVDDFFDAPPRKEYHLASLDELLIQLEMQSPELKKIVKEQEVAQRGVALAEELKQPDVTVTGGYYQRFDRNDYVSLSLSFPLYMSEKKEQQKVQAMRRANIQAISYNQVKVQLEQGLKITLHQLKRTHQELAILQENRLKIEKLIGNAKASLSVGGSLLHYFELFTQKVNNALAIKKKELSIALRENQIDQLLGVI